MKTEEIDKTVMSDPKHDPHPEDGLRRGGGGAGRVPSRARSTVHLDSVGPRTLFGPLEHGDCDPPTLLAGTVYDVFDRPLPRVETHLARAKIEHEALEVAVAVVEEGQHLAFVVDLAAGVAGAGVRVGAGLVWRRLHVVRVAAEAPDAIGDLTQVALEDAVPAILGGHGLGHVAQQGQLSDLACQQVGLVVHRDAQLERAQEPERLARVLLDRQGEDLPRLDAIGQLYAHEPGNPRLAAAW